MLTCEEQFINFHSYVDQQCINTHKYISSLIEWHLFFPLFHYNHALMNTFTYASLGIYACLSFSRVYIKNEPLGSRSEISSTLLDTNFKIIKNIKKLVCQNSFTNTHFTSCLWVPFKLLCPVLSIFQIWATF